MKRIVNTFPAKCRDCGGILPKGSTVKWAKGFGVTHLTCRNPEIVNKPTNPPPSAQSISKPAKQYDPNWVIDWPDLKETLRNFAFKSEFPKGMNQSLKNYFHGNFSFGKEWTGGDIENLKRYITEGYRTTAIQGLAGLVPPIREKRRLKYGEEGDEFNYDIAMSGDENYMSFWTKREQIPGVKLSLELDGSAGSTDALMKYQRWMAQSIYALEAAGVDCEVEIFTLSRNLFRPQAAIARTAVRVKNSGEIADFAGISAMFSPLAFRGIMFGCFSLQAHEMGLSQVGHGSGVTNRWRCYYNPEIHAIVSDCDWHATTFPEEQHTEQFKQAIRDMKSQVGD